MADKVTTWKCGKNHILGLVQRNGRGIRQLLLYREAVDPCSDEQAEVEVMAVVEGLVLDVRCSLCDDVRTWVPGQEAIQRLVETFERKAGSIP